MRPEPLFPAGLRAAARALCLAAAPLPAMAAAPAAPAATAGSDSGHACLIEPFQRIELRTTVDARILAMHVDRGAEVRKGQLLVELDSAAERAGLDAASYRAVMDGELQSADSRIAAAKEKLARREELVKEKFIAAQDRDDTRTELQQAEANKLQAKDNRRLAEIERRRLGELIEQRRLRSPINGVVTERLQQVGEIAQAGDTARAVLRLAQTHPLRVEVVLPVALYGQVKPGQKARIEAEQPLSGKYEATVSIVDKVVDSASGTFGVRLELPNPSREIPAGIRCRVHFR